MQHIKVLSFCSEETGWKLYNILTNNHSIYPLMKDLYEQSLNCYTSCSAVAVYSSTKLCREGSCPRYNDGYSGFSVYLLGMVPVHSGRYAG